MYGINYKIMIENQDNSLKVIADPINSVPKLATNVNFTKLQNGNIIISFFTKTFPEASSVLIETIIVDKDHAKEILNILEKVINN